MRTRTCAIAIAGLTFSFRTRRRRMFDMIAKRYAGYAVDGAKGALSFSVAWRAGRFGAKTEVDVKAHDGGWRAQRPDFSVAWKDDSGIASLRPSVYSFDAMIRVLLSARGLERERLVVHAAAVARAGRAFVFAGPSGSGKSTIAGLARGRILNDEIICVKCGPTRPLVYATPFWGELGRGPASHQGYPPAALFFLRKSDTETRAEPLSGAAALGRLLACCCLFGNESSTAQRGLDLAVSLLKSVPAYELTFARNAEAVEHALAGI